MKRVPHKRHVNYYKSNKFAKSFVCTGPIDFPFISWLIFGGVADHLCRSQLVSRGSRFGPEYKSLSRTGTEYL